MARYDLPQYQSVYRDPQSVKINEILRQRYVQSFAGADALQSSVDEMVSADFEGDKLEKQKLIDQYNAELDEMSRQGDYEYMGKRVATNARSFIQDYKPIKQNKANYDAYVTELDRLRKEGIDGGGISEFVYKRKLAQAKHGYFGLQRNEEGKIDEESYFSGPGVVKSIDYIKTLDDALKGIKADKASTVFDIPQDQLVLDQDGRLNVDPMVDRDTGTVKYWVETTDGKVEVSADRVGRIVKDVLADPSVQLSLEQDADLSTFDIDQNDAKDMVDQELVKIDETINGIVTGEGTFWDEDSKRNIKYKNLSETQRQEKLEEWTEYKEDVLNKRAEEGDISLLRSVERNNIVNRAMDASQAKYVYSETEHKKLLDIDDEYKISLTDKVNKSVPAVNLFADASSQSGLGGDTFSKKIEYMATTQAVINDSYKNLINKNKVYSDDQGVTAKTLEDIQSEIHNIQNAEEFTELAKSYNMTPENFRGAVNEILENESRVNLVNQKLEETKVKIFGSDYDKTISDKYIKTKKTSKTYNIDLNGQDVKDALVSSGILDSNASIKDAMDYILSETGGIGAIKMASGASKGLLFGFGKNQDVIMEALLKSKTDGKGVYDKTAVYTKDVKEQGALNYLLADLIKDYSADMKGDLKKLNKEFSKEIKTDALIIRDFGTKDDGGIKNTEYVQKQFKSVFWDESQKRGVFPPGMKIRTQDGSYEGDWATYMDKQSMWGDADYTINVEGIGLSNVPSVDGKQMLYVPIKFISGKQEGKTTYFLVDANQLQSDELDDWVNSSEFQVQKMYARGEWANVGTYKPEMFDNVRFDYTNNKIYIDLTVGDDDDGIDNPIEHTKAEGLAVLANVYANSGYADLFNEIKRKRGLR